MASKFNDESIEHKSLMYNVYAPGENLAAMYTDFWVHRNELIDEVSLI